MIRKKNIFFFNLRHTERQGNLNIGILKIRDVQQVKYSVENVNALATAPISSREMTADT